MNAKPHYLLNLVVCMLLQSAVLPDVSISLVLCCHSPSPFTSYLQNPYYFMHASLVEKDSDDDVLLIKDTTRSKDDTHLFKDNRTKATTGSSVSSLYPLKDFEDNGQESGFFVFPDLSVRMEGTYRLKFCLYEMVGYVARRHGRVFPHKSLWTCTHNSICRHSSDYLPCLSPQERCALLCVYHIGSIGRLLCKKVPWHGRYASFLVGIVMTTKETPMRKHPHNVTCW